MNKPLGRSSYGSIAHLPGSREGIGDKRLNPGQSKIMWEKLRDSKDLLIVQEKLDGSCVSIAKLDSKIIALGRSGYLAETSSYRQHQMFAAWVAEREDIFQSLLNEGERLVGEWLAQAHGTKYDLKGLSPFAAFDLMVGANRLTFEHLKSRLNNTSINMAPLIYEGGTAFSKDKMLAAIEKSQYGAEIPEGAIYRVEREGKIDFLGKYVRDAYENFKYMKDGLEVWNWEG
jgi:hypothetical protein